MPVTARPNVKCQMSFALKRRSRNRLGLSPRTRTENMTVYAHFRVSPFRIANRAAAPRQRLQSPPRACPAPITVPTTGPEALEPCLLLQVDSKSILRSLCKAAHYLRGACPEEGLWSLCGKFRVRNDGAGQGAFGGEQGAEALLQE